MKDGKTGKMVKGEDKCFSTRLEEILKRISKKKKLENCPHRCKEQTHSQIGDSFSLHDVFSLYL